MDFSEWLQNNLRQEERTQLDIARQIGVNPNDLSRWKQGQSVPEMDNLLRLAHYFREDPNRLFEMAGKAHLTQAFHLYCDRTDSRPTETDLYRNPAHADLHERIQKMLGRGRFEEVAREVSALEAKDPMHFRLREMVALTGALSGFLLHEDYSERHRDYWYNLTLSEVNPGMPEHPLQGWVVYLAYAQDFPRLRVFLCLERPKLTEDARLLIRVYLGNWLRSLVAAVEGELPAGFSDQIVIRHVG